MCNCQTCLGGDVAPGQACAFCHGTGRVFEDGARIARVDHIVGTCGACQGRGLAARSFVVLCVKDAGVCQCHACAPPLLEMKTKQEVQFPLTEDRFVTMTTPPEMSAAEVDRTHEWLTRVLAETVR